MARPILSEYGPDTPKKMASRMSGSGQAGSKPLPYDPPKGPIGLGNSGPGLGGVNYGNCGTQGPKSIISETSGSVGLHGNNRGMGSNRG